MKARPVVRTLVTRIRPQISRAAHQVRRQIGRVDNAEVRKARRLGRASRSGSPDIVYLGDSTTIFVAEYDTDRRPLHRMLQDLLGEDLTMHTLHGGSYNPPLHDGFLRQVDIVGGRPLVIVALAPRMSTLPWAVHPAYGHQRATEFLSSVDTSTPLWRIRAGYPPPTPEAFSRFYELPHPTWAGDLTIGDYVHRLKGAKVKDDDWVKLLYAYHHGGSVVADPSLNAVTALGKRLRSLDALVVRYETPVPVEKGEEMYGPAFRELAERNYAAAEEAFVAGYGPGASMVRTGLSYRTVDFIDWRDGSEHLNEHGRLRLAHEIATATAQALGREIDRDVPA